LARIVATRPGGAATALARGAPIAAVLAAARIAIELAVAAAGNARAPRVVGTAGGADACQVGEQCTGCRHTGAIRNARAWATTLAPTGVVAMSLGHAICVALTRMHANMRANAEAIGAELRAIAVGVATGGALHVRDVIRRVEVTRLRCRALRRAAAWSAQAHGQGRGPAAAARAARVHAGRTRTARFARAAAGTSTRAATSSARAAVARAAAVFDGTALAIDHTNRAVEGDGNARARDRARTAITRTGGGHQIVTGNLTYHVLFRKCRDLDRALAVHGRADGSIDRIHVFEER